MGGSITLRKFSERRTNCFGSIEVRKIQAPAALQGFSYLKQIVSLAPDGMRIDDNATSHRNDRACRPAQLR